MYIQIYKQIKYIYILNLSQLALGEVQLKKAREKSVFAHPHIDVFPESPMQLPADVYQHAYIAPEVPHLWSPDLLDRLHMEAPQRKSHRTCQKNNISDSENVLQAFNKFFGRAAANTTRSHPFPPPTQPQMPMPSCPLSPPMLSQCPLSPPMPPQMPMPSFPPMHLAVAPTRAGQDVEAPTRQAIPRLGDAAADSPTDKGLP